MSSARLLRFADRSHFLGVPAAVMLVGGGVFGSLVWATEGGWARETFAPSRLIGTLALFTLMPAYLLALLPQQLRRSREALAALAPIARAGDVAAVEARIGSLTPLAWLGLLVGFSLGVAQNPPYFEQVIESGTLHPLDVAFVSGACLLWTIVGLLLGWRLPISTAFSRLGRHLELDLYRLDRLRPLARVATTDILAVAGAMALTPLQALDAEFRFGNYGWAIAVGVPAAVLLFVLPLWGVRQNTLREKRARLAALRKSLDQVDRQDIGRLEALTAHVERVGSIPSWPVDLQLGARLVGYVIIPPLAWVAAALVENFIDRL